MRDKLITVVLMLSCMAVHAEQPATTTSYEVIKSVEDLQKQSQVIIATFNDNDELYVCSYASTSFYVDPISKANPILFDLGYYRGGDNYSFYYNGKFIVTKATGLSMDSSLENSDRLFYISIADDGSADVSSVTDKSAYIRALDKGSYYQLTTSASTEYNPIYLCKVVTKLANAPKITVEGNNVTITSDQGCKIKYQLIAQTKNSINALADDDGWLDWSPESFAAEISKYAGDVLLRAKAVYDQYESPVAEVMIHADDLTGITDIVIDVPTEYYDLRGLRVTDISNAAPGVYISRQGTNVSKVIKH